jgi:2-polyprenyl-6-methoxyphenol hydroxylase-like FAD-dependent oxidoreductase
MRMPISHRWSRHRTVLISGAGIAGPTLAWWLLRKGFIPTLERVGYKLDEVRIVDELGQRVSGFDGQTFRSATNGRYLSLLRSDRATAIYAAVARDVETMFGTSVIALEDDAEGVTVAFDNDHARRFDFVVGAGGLHSGVRKLVFGQERRFEKFLGYYTAAFTTPHYRHRDEGVYVSYTVPGRQVARYALRNGRSAFFLILAADRSFGDLRHDPGAQREALGAAFGGLGWETGEIIAAMDSADDLYFDAVAQVRLPEWSRGRVVLLGDAAYCPSLIAGQGSAFAMAGAYVLARELAEAGSNYPAAFASYEQRFRPFIDAKQKAAERFAGWFAPRTAAALRLRNAITRSLNIPWLGERLIACSLGDRFDLDA